MRHHNLGSGKREFPQASPTKEMQREAAYFEKFAKPVPVPLRFVSAKIVLFWSALSVSICKTCNAVFRQLRHRSVK